MTHSSCKTHGIRAKKLLTEVIGEPMNYTIIVCYAFIRLFFFLLF